MLSEAASLGAQLPHAERMSAVEKNPAVFLVDILSYFILLGLGLPTSAGRSWCLAV
jgi:hypothetical protein